MSEQLTHQKSISLECQVCQAKFRIPYERTKKYASAKCSRCGSKFKIADALRELEPSQAERAYSDATAFGSPILGEDSTEHSNLFMNPEDLAKFQKKRRQGTAQNSANKQDEEIQTEVEEDWLNHSDQTDESFEESFDWNDDSEYSPKEEETFQEDHKVDSDPFEDEWNEFTNDETLEELPHVSEIAEKNKKGSWVTKLFFVIWGVMFLGVLGIIAYASLTQPIWLENTYRFFNLSLHKIVFSNEGMITYEVHNIHGRRNLYIVEGKLINQFSTDARVSWVQLKGVTLDQNEKMLETAIVFAGNVLTKKQLAEQELYQIKKFYKYPNSSYELKEQEVVPFQLVFYDSGQKLSNISVKIISYVKNSQTVYPQSLEVH